MTDFKQFKNPFPGLRPFELNESNLFFGREGQSDELVARLQRTRFLAVVGTSGSGKSSLIRAGLLPALYGGLMGSAGSSWRIAIFRPGHDPIGNLAAALGEQELFTKSTATDFDLFQTGLDQPINVRRPLRLKSTADRKAGEPPKESVSPQANAVQTADQDSQLQKTIIETTLRRSMLGLVEAVEQARMPPHENLLIVVDQFEEVFRFKEVRKEIGSEDDAAAFVQLLLHASAQSAVPIYVVLTMRSDFLGDCSQFPGLPEAINQGQYLIPRMSRDERRAAITGPVAVGGGEITLPLVSRLLNDVGDNPDQLPILQHALMRTWDYCATHRRNGEPLGLEHYEAIGTMSDALSEHADEAFNELPNGRSQELAEILFKALTERGADNREIRRPTRLNAICDIAGASMRDVIAVIDVFRGGGRSFLMPPAGVTLQPETVIDISHESLIRNWLRLKDWVNEEAQSARIYRRLAEAAVLHREGSEGLLQDPALQIALDWRDKSKPNAAWAGRYHSEFDESVEYLEQSSIAREMALAERERQGNAALERERREREKAERFADEQARAAQRLRRFTFALVIISLLALCGAGATAFAFVVARQARQIAVIAQKRAEGTTKQLRETGEDLKKKTIELEQSVDNYKKSEAGRVRQSDLANERAIAAQQARKRAETETARADQQARIAEQKAREAEDNLVNLREETERNRWGRDALASFQRGDFGGALYTFEMLNRMVGSKKQPVAPDGEIRDRELAAIQGWALSNIGASQRKLGQQSKAVESYEAALAIQEKVLSKRNPELFDTLSGLGHAHREAGSFSEAEEFLKQAVKLLEDTPALMNPLDEIPNVESRARLYRALRRYDEAAPLFKRIVELRGRRAPKSPEVVNALQEYARFYVVQSKYSEAEMVYTDILAIQEEKGMVDWDLRELADSYGALGRIYAGQNKYAKAEYSFKLARLFQEYDIKQQIWLSAYNSPSEAARHEEMQKVLIDMAELYANLEKHEQAGVTLAVFLYTTKLDQGDPVVVGVKLKVADLVHHHLKDYYQAALIYQGTLPHLDDKSEDNRILRADALQQLGSLYANQLNRPADAEALFKEALSLTNRINNIVASYGPLSRLADLYQRQHRDDEAEAALKRGHEIMFQLARVPSVRDEELIGFRKSFQDYLQAIEALTKFYISRDRVADAEVVYKQALWPLETYAPGLDTRLSLIASLETFDAYEKTLKGYIRLLGDTNRPAEAGIIIDRLKKARERRDEIERQTQEFQQLRRQTLRP